MKEDGADVIKLMPSGGVLSLSDPVDAPELSQEEMNAIVDEAHRWGRRVAAHAIATQGIKNAVLGGVTTVEHGSKLDAEAVHIRLSRVTDLVPPLAIGHNSFRGNDPNVPEYARAKAATVSEQHLRSVRMAAEDRVKSVLDTHGSDFAPFGRNAQELRLMVEHGLAPAAAIRAATATAAELLGLGERTGRIAPGFAADLLLVAGDALAEIGLLERPEAILGVWLEGRRAV